jgi:DNA-binding response OmpR family regulator
VWAFGRWREVTLKRGTRILIVEDDASIARLVQLELEHEGAEVRVAHDGEAGLAAAREFGPEAVILDVMLPGMDGVAVLRELRSSGPRDGNLPIIMLTARDAPADKIHSLDRGADDYLTKPFDTGELLARLQALLRRSGVYEVIRISDLEINTATREVRRGERGVELTAREYALLETLARNHRRVLTHEALLEKVWEQEAAVETNVVEVYVGYLRRKLEACSFCFVTPCSQTSNRPRTPAPRPLLGS